MTTPHFFCAEDDNLVHVQVDKHEDDTMLVMPGSSTDPKMQVAKPVDPEQLSVIGGTTYRVGEWVERPLTTEELKLKGFLYNGVWCSVTKEDQWGLNSVEGLILMGMSVNYHFENGNTMVLSPDMWADFRYQWVGYRLSFFPMPT